ncbi:hypothetical protein Mal15_29900 [Stieleria maiorica]|uniref:DUF2383 domain-containing protein n=2 Tax=Stieleria maiorica TaxID=2795974 RepID=A0A5B9MCH6_9BACT|nr:hypothetical protein Mal15_29900 [Stieleria maiorica]
MQSPRVRPSRDHRPTTPRFWHIGCVRVTESYLSSDPSLPLTQGIDNMSVDTNPPLTDEMVQRLQDLIQANIDSAEGYNDAAAHLGDSELSDHVVQLNRQRLKFASELQTFVQVGGVRPVKDGSWLAKLHGSWLDLKANLIGRDIAEILRDIRHVEKMLENAYDETLALMTPATSTELADRLRQHLDSIRRERERISGQPPHERLDDESS